MEVPPPESLSSSGVGGEAIERASSNALASSADAARSRLVPLWIALIVLGIIIRVLLAIVSVGTDDAVTWMRFGDEIRQHGLLQTYVLDHEFNHPAIGGYWAALCATVAGGHANARHDSIFTIVFKIAPILGDCLGIWLLYRIWLPLRGRAFALLIAAMFSLSLNAIVVSGFHCNTDSLLIALAMLALYFVQSKPRPMLAGLALAAAINVKLIPVLLIPVLLLQMRSWKAAGLFLCGLGVGVLPFLPALLRVRGAFVSNVMQYNSMIDRWGVNYFLLAGEDRWNPMHDSAQSSLAYHAQARYAIFTLVAVWAIVGRLWRRWTCYELALVAFALFLIIAPGFGVQYTLLVGLPLFAVRPQWAVAYALLAGVFVGSMYFEYWNGKFPMYANWEILMPDRVATIGLVTWLTLIAIMLGVVFKPSK